MGSRVDLDGTGSSDADGDALTFAWAISSQPAGSIFPSLSYSSTATPQFQADQPGTYEISLIVRDSHGADSQPSKVTITVDDSVGPMSSGLVIQKSANFWTLTEPALTKSVDCFMGLSADSLDRRPDGVIVGVGARQIWEINPDSCAKISRGSTDENMRAIAVSAQGQAFAISDSGNRLYKVAPDGKTQSRVSLSGVSTYVDAIDFGPDGHLYGLGTTVGSRSVVQIDPDTGVTTVVFQLPVATTWGDIDIDASGVLRTVIGGTLYKFDLATGNVISTTTVPDFGQGYSLAPIVYVP